MECCIRRIIGWHQLQALCCILLLAVARLPPSNAQIGGGGLPFGTWPLVTNVAPGQLTQVVDALKAAGFSLAGLTLNALRNFIPAYTTLMIPTNEAIAQFVNLNQTQLPSVLLYHAVSQVLPFQVLSQYPVGQMLPTMLFGKQIVVTNNSSSNFMVDDAKVVKPNMCGGSGVVTCHGIDRVLLPSFAAVSPASAPFVPPGLVPVLAPAAALVPPPASLSQPSPSPPQIVVPGSAIAPGAAPVAISVGPTEAVSGASMSTVSFVATALVCLFSFCVLMFMQ